MENMAHLQTQYIPGDPRLVDQLVYELKSKGIFDQFRKECIADVDTRPAYQNLRQRVESSVATFLSRQCWKPDLNKNQLREKLRKHILDGNYLEQGVERIVDQVVNPKVASVFIPQVEDLVYNFLGITRKKTSTNAESSSDKPKIDLLADLEAVSPGSVIEDKNELMEISDDNTGEPKMEVDEEIKLKNETDKIELPVKKFKIDDSPDEQLSANSDLNSKDSDVICIDQNSIPLPEEEIKLENIPAPENSPPKRKVELEKIALPREPDLSTDIPLPDEIPKLNKDQYFKPIVLTDDCGEDDSSSDSSLRRNMSPLTPIRNFNNENSCDALQGFDNDSGDSKFDDKKELNTFSFSLEAKSENSSDDVKTEIQSNKDVDQTALSYQFNDQVNINTFTTPLYDDSSNSNNLQIDYESDANSKINITETKAVELPIAQQNSDLNSNDSKKEQKLEEKKSSQKSAHRSRNSHRHSSSSKDRKTDSKHSSSRERKDVKSSKEEHKKSSKDDHSKSKTNHKEISKDRMDKKDSRDSSKHRSSSHKSSSHKDSNKDSKSHKSSSSSQRHSSSKHSDSDQKKSSSSSHKDKNEKSLVKEKNLEKGSKEKSRDSKSNSHRSDKDRKSSSKSKHEDKEKEKKDKKDSDDHYSLSGRGSHKRRSTDRDSNDGSSSSKGSNNQPSTKSTDSKRDGSKSSGSKSDQHSTSSDTTSPGDKDSVNEGFHEAKNQPQYKPVVRVDTHLETPIIAPPRFPFVPDVTLKKPKIAANFEEAKKLMKMRKFLDEEQRKMNQEAALLLEFQANVRPSMSQVYSSIPGPELEFACINNVKTHKVYKEDNINESFVADSNHIGEVVQENTEKETLESDNAAQDRIAQTIYDNDESTTTCIINQMEEFPTETISDINSYIEATGNYINIVNEVIGVENNINNSFQHINEISIVEHKIDNNHEVSEEESENMHKVLSENDINEDQTDNDELKINEINEGDMESMNHMKIQNNDNCVLEIREHVSNSMTKVVGKGNKAHTELFEVTIITEELSEEEGSNKVVPDDSIKSVFCAHPEEDDFNYFAEYEKYTADLESDRFHRFLKSYIENSAFSNKLYLINCDSYEENIIRDVVQVMGEFEIVNYHKNGCLKLHKPTKNIVKDVNISSEISLPLENSVDFEPFGKSHSPLFSPVKSEYSFECSDYHAKLEEMVNKTSRQQVMEIILGVLPDVSPTKMPRIDYCTESNIDSGDNNLKRKIDDDALDNNNENVFNTKKVRKSSESDQITSTTEDEDTASIKTPVNNTRSQYLGRARRIGLPRPRKPVLPSSPSSDKSVENYEQNTHTSPPSPNGKLKSRIKVQRYDTSDLYKPKLHYLSRRNNIT